MTAAPITALQDLLRDAARAVVEESAPALVQKLLPQIVAEVKAEIEKEASAGGPVYVSVKDAAKIMGAHPATIRRLMREGKLGRYSVGTQPRLKLSEVHAYVARDRAVSPTVILDEKALEILAHRPKTK